MQQETFSTAIQILNVNDSKMLFSGLSIHLALEIVLNISIKTFFLKKNVLRAFGRVNVPLVFRN